MLQGDLSRFTKPNVQTVEVILAAAATGEILPDLFFHRGPRLVKRVILSATDYADNGVPAAAYTQNLGLITARWWIRMQEQASGVLQAIPTFDNAHWDSRALVAPGGGAVPFSVAWNLDHPFTVYNNDVMNVDWNNRATTAPFASGPVTFRVALHGHGASSGKFRTMNALVVVAANPATGTAAVIQNAINQFGEDFIAERLVIETISTLMNVPDSRYFNHVAMRIYFSGRQTLSLCGTGQNDWVPVLAYGSHRNAENCVAICDWLGAPFVMDTSEGMGWQFTNGAGNTQRIQVTLVSLLPE
jgi:hypothetical protein